MKKQKKLIRTGFFAVLIFSIILCSFTTGMIRPRALGTPFRTVPPVNATLATPIGALTPVPTPIPTLGPGQYFEEGGDIPELVTKNGDDEFGYGEIAGSSDLYLIWVTDEDGTHYLIIEENDDNFSNDSKPDDFLDLISKREEIQNDIHDIEIKITEQQASRKGSNGGAIIIVAIGGIVCTFITAGGCFLPFATGGLGLVGKAIAHNTSANDLAELLVPLEKELSKNEQNILGRFETMK